MISSVHKFAPPASYRRDFGYTVTCSSVGFLPAAAGPGAGDGASMVAVFVREDGSTAAQPAPAQLGEAAAAAGGTPEEAGMGDEGPGEAAAASWKLLASGVCSVASRRALS